MTDHPYTGADLRAEAARQLKNATEDPDFGGISEQMEGHKIPSRGDFHWDQLGEDDFDTAKRKIDDLLSDAADVSEWAIQLGAANLTPHPAMAWQSTTGGYDVAVQVATTPDLTDDARDELLSEIRKTVGETVCRVLGLKPVSEAAA